MAGEAGEEAHGEAAGASLKFPFIWLCDDAMVSFQQLELGDDGRKHVKPHKAGTPMFLRAFINVQSLCDVSKYAVVGFLRERGVACFSKRFYAHNVMSIYKCVLLNLDLLGRLVSRPAPLSSILSPNSCVLRETRVRESRFWRENTILAFAIIGGGF